MAGWKREWKQQLGGFMAASDPLENTEKSLFKLDLGAEAGTLQPRSLEELAQWLQTEQTFWAWTAQQPAANVPEVQRQLQQSLPQLLAWVAEARAMQQQGNPAGRDQRLSLIQRGLQERYVQVRLLHSDSPRAKFLASMVDKNVAAFALRYFIGMGFASPGNPAEIRGVVQAVLFDLSVTPDRAASEATALRELRARIENEHENLRAQAGKLNDDFKAAEISVASLHETQRKQHDEAQAARVTEFKALVTNATESLDKLKTDSERDLKAVAETYDKKMSLQSAVTYLRDKARTHTIAAVVMGIVSLVVGVGFGALAVWLGATLLGDKPAWHKIATAALAATLGFWLLRILVRMFLSNLHLATDSRNRATLMQTYLALLREKGGLESDDRQLILKMLFRPFADGVVRDDAAPPGFWDIASRLTGGK